MRFISLLFCFTSLFYNAHNGYGQCSFGNNAPQGLECSDAILLCGYEMDGFMGRLPEMPSPGDQPVGGLCQGNGSADNIEWFAFIAETSNIEIEITYSNCSGGLELPYGFQAGIMTGCDTADVSVRLDCETSRAFDPINLSPDPSEIIPGEIYYLFVDGWTGNVCDFTIDIIDGVCTNPPPAPGACPQDCGVFAADAVADQFCTFFPIHFT